MMAKFIYKILLISFIPILLLIGYIFFDPFKVIHQYDNYTSLEMPCTEPNRDNMSVRKFVENYPKYNYNSFVFGSSRTLAFSPKSWKKHLKNTDSPYMFDASCETLYGIYTKIKYLDSLHIPLNNVLIILCRDFTFADHYNKMQPLFIKNPLITGGSYYDFHSVCFKGYLNPKFLYSYYMAKLIKEYKPYMVGFLFDKRIIYDPIDNQMKLVDLENAIIQDSDKYYNEHPIKSVDQESIDEFNHIGKLHFRMLYEIKQIFEKNKSNYKVILPPLYDKVKYTKFDYDLMSDLFGNHLYDFSGKNEITVNKLNYYEMSHFRPHVGDSIFNIIYKK